jgi:hypothetical protein
MLHMHDSLFVSPGLCLVHALFACRFWGLNIARMLGDRYLKEQDVGFTAEPYVSEGLRVEPQEEALLVLASDGLWDVVSQERVAALATKAAAAAAAAGGTGSGEGVGGSGCGGQEGGGAAAAAADGVAGSGGSTGCDAASSSSSGNVRRDGQLRRNVAAVVAEELMQAALRLHSKDDISIMVLHVLPAAVAGARQLALPGASSSGSM